MASIPCISKGGNVGKGGKPGKASGGAVGTVGWMKCPGGPKTDGTFDNLRDYLLK